MTDCEKNSTVNLSTCDSAIVVYKNSYKRSIRFSIDSVTGPAVMTFDIAPRGSKNRILGGTVGLHYYVDKLDCVELDMMADHE